MDTIETQAEGAVFKLKAPLLQQGRQDTIVAGTDLMSVVVKVYASGGENGLHKHVNEDHTFVVLQGQATFSLGTMENTKVVNKYEGVMLPRNSLYRFLSSGTENLVMLRIGASEKWIDGSAPNPYAMTGKADEGTGRLQADGSLAPANSKQNHQVERITLPGQFFAG